MEQVEKITLKAVAAFIRAERNDQKRRMAAGDRRTVAQVHFNSATQQLSIGGKVAPGDAAEHVPDKDCRYIGNISYEPGRGMMGPAQELARLFMVQIDSDWVGPQ